LPAARLLIDPPAPGAWNMGVDETLLEWAAQTGGYAWRFYRWDEPTLSLGYFQAYDDRAQHAPSRECPAVRRATGGGAIVHDAELTYAIVVPEASPLAGRRHDLYRTVHQTLIDALVGWGVRASMCETQPARDVSPSPFLCFQRRAPGDVLVGQAKIAGSAQRRCRGAVLQHGSVLIERSAAAPELPGLNELSATPIGEDDLLHVWMRGLSAALGFHGGRSPLSDSERHRALELVAAKYGSAQWTQRRER
jgi:lipoate-protein ligase A